MIYMNIFMMSLVLLVMSYKFMLVVLMMIELLVLNMAMIIFLVYSIFGLDIYLIYYVIFSVCESVLGIALLVLIVRETGDDMYYSFKMCKFV